VARWACLQLNVRRSAGRAWGSFPPPRRAAVASTNHVVVDNDRGRPVNTVDRDREPA
jgi:hypothetical protein